MKKILFPAAIAIFLGSFFLMGSKIVEPSPEYETPAIPVLLTYIPKWMNDWCKLETRKEDETLSFQSTFGQDITAEDKDRTKRLLLPKLQELEQYFMDQWDISIEEAHAEISKSGLESYCQ